MLCKELWMLFGRCVIGNLRGIANRCNAPTTISTHPLSHAVCVSHHTAHCKSARWWLIGGSAAPVATNMIIWGFVVVCDSRTKVFHLLTVSAASQVNWLPLQSPLMTQRTSIDTGAARSSSSVCALSWHDICGFCLLVCFDCPCVTLRHELLRLVVEAAANWSLETPLGVVAALVWRAQDENCLKERWECSQRLISVLSHWSWRMIHVST